MYSEELMDNYYSLLSDDNNWKQNFMKIYTNNILENPYKFDEKKFVFKSVMQFLDTGIKKYTLASKLLKNINETNIDFTFQKLNTLCKGFDTLKSFKNKQYTYNSLLPFKLSIPCKKIEWSTLYEQLDDIPNKLRINWEKELFDTMQLKIDNNFEIEPSFVNIQPSQIFRTKHFVIYTFEQIKELHFLELLLKIKDSTTSVLPNCPLIEIAFNQSEYKYDLSNIQRNIEMVENNLLKLIEDKSNLVSYETNIV